jgi:hypothetical protein
VTNLLFACDGSERSRRALRYAERLNAGDSVRVISVATALARGPQTPACTDPTSDPAEQRRQLDEPLAVLVAEGGVQAEPIAAIGNRAAEIILAAESRGVD